MKNERDKVLESRMGKGLHRTVDWWSESMFLDRVGKGELAEHARGMADRWQAVQRRIRAKMRH
jgi:hypothetical protein